MTEATFEFTQTSMKEPIYIVDGVRTPFAKAGTTLADSEAVDLGKTALRLLVARTGIDPSRIEEVIIGCVAQPADSANVSRVVALRAGIPESVPAITVHRNCASGFEAVTQAAEKMLAGRGDIFVVGGVESMSQIPLLYSYEAAKKFGAFARAKNLSQKLGVLSSFRPTDFQPRIGLQLGLSDPVCGCNMGQTAETVGRDFNITREEQDAFAMRSHHKAVAAREKLKQEITPVYLPKSKNGQTFMDQDNGPRENQTMEALAKLKPVFEPETGTVTAGNSSQITDGAAALLLNDGTGAEGIGIESARSPGRLRLRRAGPFADGSRPGLRDSPRGTEDRPRPERCRDHRNQRSVRRAGDRLPKGSKIGNLLPGTSSTRNTRSGKSRMRF